MAKPMARRDRSDEKGVQSAAVQGNGNLRRILLMVSIFAVVLGLSRLPYGEWARQWLPNTYRVEIQGHFQHVSDVELLERVMPFTGVALWEVDEAEVQKAVLTHPWLRKVKVTKRWPDVITLKMREFNPVSQWGDEHLLDASGVVFPRPDDADVEGMPWLYSPDFKAGRDLWRAYATVNEQLVGVELPVSRLWVDERGAWHLRFSNDLELRLGRHERDQRLARFVSLVPKALKDRLPDAAYVDLRYSNGFAVGWRPQVEES